MESIINIKKIPQDNSGMIRQEYTWLDTKYIMLPNVIGMNLDNAQKELKGFKIEYSGSGEKVVDMSPSPGDKVKENSTVKLLLN